MKRIQALQKVADLVAGNDLEVAVGLKLFRLALPQKRPQLLDRPRTDWRMGSIPKARVRRARGLLVLEPNLVDSPLEYLQDPDLTGTVHAERQPEVVPVFRARLVLAVIDTAHGVIERDTPFLQHWK